MLRISLRDLEEALKDPLQYRKRFSGNAQATFIPKRSYFNELRKAILFKYHKPHANAVHVREQLDDRLSVFKDPTRIDDTIEQFDWYVEDYEQRGNCCFETASNVTVPLLPSPNLGIVCSGQVSRLDMIPNYGYIAWLFRGKDYMDWRQELRMPLIQLAVAYTLNVPTHEVAVGVYSFEERVVEQHSFSDSDISSAQQRLDQLFEDMDLLEFS